MFIHFYFSNALTLKKERERERERNPRNLQSQRERGKWRGRGKTSKYQFVEAVERSNNRFHSIFHLWPRSTGASIYRLNRVTPGIGGWGENWLVGARSFGAIPFKRVGCTTGFERNDNNTTGIRARIATLESKLYLVHVGMEGSNALINCRSIRENGSDFDSIDDTNSGNKVVEK